MNCASVFLIITAALAAIAGVLVVVFNEQVVTLYNEQLKPYIPESVAKFIPEVKPKEKPKVFASPRDEYLETPHTSGKISQSSGDYLTFGGVTCIANIADRNTNPGWTKIHDFLESDPFFSQYYTPLPVSSYHMTIHPMFTVSSTPGYNPRAFDAELLEKKSGFIEFYDELEKNPFVPEGKFVTIYTGGIIVIAVELDDDNQERADGLRTMVEDVLGIDRMRKYRQHITLAYRSKEFDPKDAVDMKKSYQTLVGIMKNEVLPNSGDKLVFEKAELMLFHDMCLFQPTDPHKWTDEPLGDLPPTPAELKQKKKKL